MVLILPGGDLPIYEQIVFAIKEAIFSGEIGYGQELPPLRELAAAMRINMHTVRHAYSLLAADGVIEMRAGNKTRVAERTELAKARGDVMEKIAGKISFLLKEARWRGADRNEIMAMVNI